MTGAKAVRPSGNSTKRRNPKFSVLMSIYGEENPQYLTQCLDSLLLQSLPADEWVIVEDGPLTEGLYEVLDLYDQQFPRLINRVRLREHVGLGLALAEGIRHCSHELVARMDADDIACEERFERQIEQFLRDRELDLCGGWIEEFEGDVGNIVSRRKVPLEERDIREYQRRRDAFNHVTVMYKRQAVLDAGNYTSSPLMEDTVLWARMLQNNARCMNIPDYLVKVRVGNGFYERRGGWEYFKLYKNGKREVLETGFISKGDYYSAVIAQLLVSLMPAAARSLVFRHVLHRS